MAKKKTTKPEYKPTKRLISNLQKQRRKQKNVLFSAIAIVSIAIIFVALGLIFQWYIPQVKPLGDVVIEVNDKQFKTNYFIDSVKYQTQGANPQYIPYYLDSVASTIIRSELIRQHSEELGYTVNDKEVNELLQENEIKANDATRDYARAYLIQEKLIEEHFLPQLPKEAEHREVMAMFLESESQIERIKAKLAEGESFGELAEQYSLDSYTQEAEGELGFKPAGIIARETNSLILEEAIFNTNEQYGFVYEEEKNKSVSYWLIEILERRTANDSDEARVRAMLFSNEEDAEKVKALLDQGEDFNELASQYSLIWDEEDEPDLGWIVPGDVSEAFDEFVFHENSEMNIVSDPVKDVEQSSKGGWWLFEIINIETMSVSDDHMESMAFQLLNDWISEIQADEDNIINNYLDDEKKEFVLSKIM